LVVTLTGVVGGGDVWGKHRVDIRDITGDSSYPAGGYALTGQTFGLRSIVGMSFIGGNTAAVGIIPYWNNQTNKLQFIYPTQTGTSPNVGAEAVAGTNLSTVTVRAIVVSLDD
jgi:hypothetical protein